MNPKDIRTLHSNCEHSHDGLFRVHLTEADYAALLDEIERLTAERDRLTGLLDKVSDNHIASQLNGAREAIARKAAEAEVERLTAERDELVRWREGWLAVDEMCESVAIAAAFQRGVAAMREAAVMETEQGSLQNIAFRICALPDPEDKS